MLNVIDNLLKLDSLKQVQYEVAQREAKILKMKIECGGCKLFMTDLCGREKFMRVSIGMTKCNSFQISDWNANKIKELEVEVEMLNKKLKETNFK